MHYVLVVHGTWNAPDRTVRMWYQFDPTDPANFCQRLNDQLETNGLSGAVWPSPEGRVVDFSWSGENSHEARLAAGDRLAHLMREISHKDPDAHIHLIGHSHGGNVVLRAVSRRMDGSAEQARSLLASILREPSDDAMAAVEEAIKKQFTDGDDCRAERLRPLLQECARSAFAAIAADRSLASIRRDDNLAMSGQMAVAVSHGPLSDVYRAFAQRLWQVNGPASVTLLGTPFYRKVWRRNKVLRTLRLVPSVIVSTLVVTSPFYLLAMLASAVLAVLPAVNMVSWNPLAWPIWLQIPLALVMAVFGLTFGFVDTVIVRDTDTNLYFDETSLNKLKPQAPTPALVVSAGRLDESFLAMSADPFAVAFFVPQLSAILGNSLDSPAYDEQTGRSIGFSVLGEAYIDLLARGAWKIGYLLVSPIWVPLRDRVIHPLLSRVLLDVVKATAFGLPPSELAGARIEISNRLQLPTWFEETHVDAADVLLHAPPPVTTPVPPEQAAAQYEFLHVDEQLELKKPLSALWKTVSAAMPDIRRHYRDQEPARLERDLLLHSVMLEERLKEIAGSVPLTHSRYYSNQQIIETIARFVARNAEREPSPGVSVT